MLLTYNLSCIQLNYEFLLASIFILDIFFENLLSDYDAWTEVVGILDPYCAWDIDDEGVYTGLKGKYFF